MPISVAKNTDKVKFLAFRQLMREHASPVTIKTTLEISRTTYYLYLKHHNRLVAKEREGS